METSTGQPIGILVQGPGAAIARNDLGMHDFYNYNSGSLSLADEDLPELDYAEVEYLLSQWKKAGLLVTGSSYYTYRLKEGVPEAYWQWLSKQTPFENCVVEPEKVYSSDLAGTLNNLLNLLLMITQLMRTAILMAFLSRQEQRLS